MDGVQEEQENRREAGLVIDCVVIASGKPVAHGQPLAFNQDAEPFNCAIVWILHQLHNRRYLCSDVPTVFKTNHHTRRVFHALDNYVANIQYLLDLLDRNGVCKTDR